MAGRPRFALQTVFRQSAKSARAGADTTTVTVRKALILAAGKGSRLGRFTTQMPKPMLRIHDRPVLETHVRRLKAAGVTEIWINLHHAPETIRTHFGATVRYSEEEHLLGTAGALRKLAAEFKDGPFFVVYGDNYMELDYAAVPER